MSFAIHTAIPYLFPEQINQMCVNRRKEGECVNSCCETYKNMFSLAPIKHILYAQKYAKNAIYWDARGLVAE